MATAPTLWREPQEFTAGDTLLFQRNLPDYLPSNGWAIRLTVTANRPNGAERVAQAVSAPDVTNNYHAFNVPDFCGDLTAGVYVLSEEVFNAAGNADPLVAAGTRHQIYVRPDFNIRANLADEQADAPVQTEAQEMLAALRASYKGLIQQQFQETDVQRNRFVLQKQNEVLEQIKYWKALRQNEIQIERMRNGQRPGNVTEAVFAIG